jgi:hypothetical protein
MNIDYVGADADGRIVFTGNVPEDMYELQTPPTGGSLVLGLGEATKNRVVDGEIVAREVMPATIAGLAISAVPPGTLVNVDGTAYTDPVTDGVVDLSFGEAGTHVVTLTCWPFQDAVFTVESA